MNSRDLKMYKYVKISKSNFFMITILSLNSICSESKKLYPACFLYCTTVFENLIIIIATNLTSHANIPRRAKLYSFDCNITHKSCLSSIKNSSNCFVFKINLKKKYKSLRAMDEINNFLNNIKSNKI